MVEKDFKIPAEVIRRLISPMGSCIASDQITVDGHHIGYMYREHPIDSLDSGWRFMSGLEDQDYVDNPDNLMIYDVNTIANYDSAIIPYLTLNFGSELLRKSDNTFSVLDAD